jgi:hypothetical protein
MKAKITGKGAIFLIGIFILSLILLAGCVPKPSGPTGHLFNETLNQQIENLTNPINITNATNVPKFTEFFYNYTPRSEAKYEIASDDVFTLSKGNFTSTQISFFGVMLGDSYESVIERLGIPDMMYTAPDKSYRNLDYRNKIGIGGVEAGLTFHIENNTVTRITAKPPFKKYMQGNTSIGTDKEIIYALLDVPDYQNFIASLRIFHYVEKGADIYFDNKYIDRIAFSYPKEYKGVTYVTHPVVVSENVVGNQTIPVYNNITEPVLIE